MAENDEISFNRKKRVWELEGLYQDIHHDLKVEYLIQLQ